MAVLPGSSPAALACVAPAGQTTIVNHASRSSERPPACHALSAATLQDNRGPARSATARGARGATPHQDTRGGARGGAAVRAAGVHETAARAAAGGGWAFTWVD